MSGKSRKGAAPGRAVQLRGRAPELIYCPGCYENKPPDGWLDAHIDYDPKAAAPVCDECANRGIPKVRSFTLPLHQQIALKAYLEAPNPTQALKDAAAASGMATGSIRNLLTGRRSPEFRMAFLRLLEEKGVGLTDIASIMGDAAQAEEHKFNSASGEFEHFPDHRTRMIVAKHATKIMSLEPPVAMKNQPAVNLTINHNLGGGEEIDPPNYLRVKPSDEVVDIDVG